MCNFQNIHLSCGDDLQFQLEDIAHVVRDFLEGVVATQDKQSSVLSPDVVRSLHQVYGALMQAAFSVYLSKDLKKRQDNNPA